MRTLAISLLLALSVAGVGCKEGGSQAANAVIGTALGLTASAISRASGGCYAACTEGYICDPESGLCKALPCYGRCADDEYCDIAGRRETCRKRGTGVDADRELSDDARRGPTIAPRKKKEN